MAPTTASCCKPCWRSNLPVAKCWASPIRNPSGVSRLPRGKPGGRANNASGNRRCGNAVCRPLASQQQHCDFVVRAAQDRCVDLLVEQADAAVKRRSHHKRRPEQDQQPAQQHLFEVVRGWSAQGRQDLELDATKTQPKRVAHVVISLGCLRLLPPDSQPSHDLPPLVVWVVRVWEPEPPEGVEPLEWILLTSVPTQTVEQAWERVDWYRARWIVEDYHQGLKTGCRIEQRQLQS